MLFFKPNAASLDLADADPGSIAELLAGTTVRLSRLFTDLASLTRALRAIRSLASKQQEAEEEYGVSVAYCAFGLATWARDEGDIIAKGQLNTIDSLSGESSESEHADESSTPQPRRASAYGIKPAVAPVVLRSLELTSRPGSVDSWELTLSGDAQINPVLVHVLNSQGASIDEEQVLEAGDDTKGEFRLIYDRLEKACSDVSGFNIEDRTLLGAFSYLKQPMVADCEDVEALLSSDLVAALAGDEEAVAGIRSLTGEINEFDPDYKPVESEFLVLNADASQCFVVNAAVAGRNLVVQGPPGTGKSQTIANVVAALVANGKRILFVAQKRAAITAVLDRLEDASLGALTLDLFAASGSRRYVAEELGRVLDRQNSVLEPIVVNLHTQLTSARDHLVSHRDALHTHKVAWGVTVNDLFALQRSLPVEAHSSLRLPMTTLDKWHPSSLDELSAEFGELTAKGGLDPERLTRPGWSVRALNSFGELARANEMLITVTSQLLPNALDSLGSLATEFGVEMPTDPGPVNVLMKLLGEASELEETIPGALVADLAPSEFERLMAATDKAYRKQSATKLGWSERRRARRVTACPYSRVRTRSVTRSFIPSYGGREPRERLGQAWVVRAPSGLCTGFRQPAKHFLICLHS